MKNWNYLLLIQIISFGFLAINGGKSENSLLKHLFDPNRKDAHNGLERPVQNDTKSLKVKVRVYLTQIIDVDEKNEIIVVSLYMHMRWQDYHFHWDPLSYNGITVLNIPPNKVWKPDIVLFNSADEETMTLYPSNTQAYYTTVVQWSPPGIFKATCDINVEWFPFDKQTCILKFGSWTYNRELLDLRLDCAQKYNPNHPSNCSQHDFVVMDAYKENDEFNIISSQISRKQYDFNEESYVVILVNIHIQRRSSYYIFNYILPCILVSIMALMVFMLPPDTGAKISLGVTVMLSMTMFLLLVADKLPQSSLVAPLISKYFLCIMVLCSLSLMFTVLVLNFHFRSDKSEPESRIIKIVINEWMAKFLCMTMRRSIKKNTSDKGHVTNVDISLVDEPINAEESAKMNVQSVEDDSDFALEEWKFAASVIDRFCLFMFTLFIIIATIVIFSNVEY